MVNENDYNESGEESRRSVLKKLGSASAVGAVGIGGAGSALVSSPASASSSCYSGSEEGTLCEIDPANYLTSYTLDTQCANGEFEVGTEGAASILYVGSSDPEETSGQTEWLHHFAVGGQGRTQDRDAERDGATDCYGDWSLRPIMDYTEMFLANNPNDPGDESNSLYTPQGGNDIGASPNPDYSNDPGMNDLLFTTLTEVATVMSPSLDRLETAYNIASSMDGAPSNTYDNKKTYRWSYPARDRPSEPSHTAKFKVSSDQRDTCAVYGYNEFQSADQYGTYVTITWSVDVTDGSNNEGTISASPARTESAPSPDDVKRPEWFPEDRVIDKVKVAQKSSKRKKDLHIPSDRVANDADLSNLDQGNGVTLKRFPSEIKATVYIGHTE